jgi:dTDP-4-dehydrorhamnose 3,5-epimerase
MIDGVRVKELRVLPDQRGWLAELVRSDDDDFVKFGQVYVSVTYPGVVKAWHLHRRQHDLVICLGGMILLVLYDDREGSPTRGEVQELHMGTRRPLRVRVPPSVHHGWKCTSPGEAMVVNVSSELYDRAQPDEVRLPPHSKEIPYDWTRRDG